MLLKVVTYYILLSLYGIASDPISRSISMDDDGLQDFVNCTSASEFPNISEFSFNPHELVMEDTLCLSFQMFNESGLIGMLNISTTLLGRFIQQAQRTYQKVPYHNWHHGFSVLQFSFAVLKTCQLLERNHVTPLEGLALLTAAMCHDLDHPGTNHKYQLEINSSLAQKYKDQGSILERHHINMALSILENNDTNFINHFDEIKQTQFKHLISQIILATDLPEHLKMLSEMKLVSTSFNNLNGRHRELLCSLIISCADLSDQVKDWTISRDSFSHLMTEFFIQGDLEKQIGLVPSNMMDRNEAKIPQLQVEFFTRVILSNFQLLESLYPETKTCLDNAEQNFLYWQKSIPYYEKQLSLGRKPIDIISDRNLDNMSTLYVNEEY